MSDGVVEARIICDYRLPISPHNDVIMTGPFPLSEAEWERFMLVLDAMRPGLVGEQQPEESAETAPPW